MMMCCVWLLLLRFDYLKSRITSSPVGYPGGSYPIQFLLLALYRMESDHGSLAFEVLTSDKKHGWIAMMREWNATTTMECWSPTELVRRIICFDLKHLTWSSVSRRFPVLI